MERDRVIADRTHSQARLERSSPRSSWKSTRQLVSSAWRSAALFWCAGSPRQRLEQRHEPLQAVGQRPRRDRQPLGGHPRGNAVHAEAGTVLEQEAPRSWSRRASWGTAAAPGAPTLPWATTRTPGPAPARTADHALVGLDLDLTRVDSSALFGDRAARTGRRRTHPAAGCALRCAIEPGPLGAAVAGRRRAAPRLCSEPGLSCCSLSRRAPSTAPPHARSLSSWTSSVSIRFRDVFAPLRRRAFRQRLDRSGAAFAEPCGDRRLQRTATSTIFLTARSPASSDSSAFLIARSLAG